MPSGMTLAELICVVKGHGKRGGLRYQDLAARRPTDPETGKPYGPDEDRLQQMVRYSLATFPHPRTIQGLAVMLRVTEQAVVDSCARSLGLQITRAPSRLEVLLPATDCLDETTVTSILHVIHRELDLAAAEAAVVPGVSVKKAAVKQVDGRGR